MSYTDDELNYIYDKTGGYCYHCGRKLAWINYGVFGARGDGKLTIAGRKRKAEPIT